MAKIKINYPQVEVKIETKIIEVTQKEKDDLLSFSSGNDRVNFIWKHMSQLERDSTNGIHWVSDCEDIGYAGIKEV